MFYYSQDHCIQIIKWYYGGNSARRTRDLFSVEFPDIPIPSDKTILNIIKQFEKTGSVINSKNKTTQNPNISEEQEILETQICGHIETDPTTSCRELAEEFEISKTTVCRVLKKHGYSSYKVKNSQQLLEEDPFRRMQFCETMLEKCHADQSFLSNVLFSDESTFMLHGKSNSSIVRYWSTHNLHFNNPIRTQYPQKLNVWAGILNNHIIGPLIIDGNLNSQKYLELLRNQVVPVLNEQFNIEETWFQHDGCPAHNSIQVTNYLNEIFPNRWIGNNGPIKWPPRSPDLAPNDFFYWGYLKNEIYGFNRPQNLEELQQKLLNISQNISPQILENVKQNFYHRLGYCLMQNGHLFEHLI